MIDPRPPPRSGLVLSPLGLGTAALGDLIGDRAAGDAATTVDLALALANGITYADTAPHYGLGAAERRAGAALARHPRGQFTLSTKVGRVIDERAGTETFDFSPAAVRASLEGQSAPARASRGRHRLRARPGSRRDRRRAGSVPRAARSAGGRDGPAPATTTVPRRAKSSSGPAPWPWEQFRAEGLLPPEVPLPAEK